MIAKQKYERTALPLKVIQKKIPCSAEKSQFSTSKIIRNFLYIFFIEDYESRNKFFIIDIIDNITLLLIS